MSTSNQQQLFPISMNKQREEEKEKEETERDKIQFIFHEKYVIMILYANMNRKRDSYLRWARPPLTIEPKCACMATHHYFRFQFFMKREKKLGKYSFKLCPYYSRVYFDFLKKKYGLYRDILYIHNPHISLF